MGIWTGIKKIFGSGKSSSKKPLAAKSIVESPELVLFQDAQGNFSILRPKKLRYDEKIAVLDGKYTIAFESADGRVRFCISLDTQPARNENNDKPIDPKTFDFASYAKEKLESPSSGIYTPVKKTAFRGMEAYGREYSYSHEGQKYIGGGLMFYAEANQTRTNSDGIVFDLSWNAPQKRWETYGPTFERMMDSLLIRKGIA